MILLNSLGNINNCFGRTEIITDVQNGMEYCTLYLNEIYSFGNIVDILMYKLVNDVNVYLLSNQSYRLY